MGKSNPKIGGGGGGGSDSEEDEWETETQADRRQARNKPRRGCVQVASRIQLPPIPLAAPGYGFNPCTYYVT
jgi:hypothetical protein